MDTQNNVKQFAIELYAKHVAQELLDLHDSIGFTCIDIICTISPKDGHEMADKINVLYELEGKDKIEPSDLDDIKDDIINGYRAATDLLKHLSEAMNTISETIDRL